MQRFANNVNENESTPNVDAVDTNVIVHSKYQHVDPDNCVDITEYGTIDEDGIPALLHQIIPQLIDAFIVNDQHWTNQIIYAFADGYSTATRILELLQRYPKEYTLNEILLIWHWFFRGATVCEGQPTLEYQMRSWRQNDWRKSNN